MNFFGEYAVKVDESRMVRCPFDIGNNAIEVLISDTEFKIQFLRIFPGRESIDQYCRSINVSGILKIQKIVKIDGERIRLPEEMNRNVAIVGCGECVEVYDACDWKRVLNLETDDDDENL